MHTLRYIFDGAGHWTNRWHCTGGDVPLLTFTLLGCFWMTLEYARYAHRVYLSRDLSPTSSDRKHKSWLCVVFILCGAIHALGAVLPWFCTPYYLLASLFWLNGYLTHRLNGSKLQLLADQEFEAGHQAKHNAEQLRSTLNALPVLAWTARADGWVDWYNAQWYAYTGTAFPDMEGWGWRSVHDPKTLPDVLAKWKQCIATRMPFEMVFPLRRHDGAFRFFLTRVSPVIDDQDGTIIRWFGTNTDVEHSHQNSVNAENAMAELTGRLAAAERGT